MNAVVKELRAQFQVPVTRRPRTKPRKGQAGAAGAAPSSVSPQVSHASRTVVSSSHGWADDGGWWGSEYHDWYVDPETGWWEPTWDYSSQGGAWWARDGVASGASWKAWPQPETWEAPAPMSWAQKVQKGPAPLSASSRKEDAASADAAYLLASSWPQNGVRNASAARRSLEAGELPKGVVAWCKSDLEVKQLTQLATLHELQGRFALLVKSSPDSKTGQAASFAVTNGEEKWLLPFRVHPLVEAEGLPPLPSALTQAAKTPAAPEVVRLSVTVPKVLAPKDLWESFKDQPGAQLKSWCERVCPAALRQSFSWRETTLSQKGRSVVVLQGLAVVDKTKAEGLLDCSGQGGVFFCTDKASVQKKVQVKWMQSMEAETMPAYLKRVQDEARKSGLSIAWRVGDPVQLGLRCKPGTGSATPGVTAAWRVRKVPASWTEEDLLEALASAGWHELSVTSVPSFPKRPWFIRARAPHDAPCDLLGIEIGKDATLLLDRIVGRSNVKVASQTSLNPRVSRNSDRSVNPKASGQQSAGAATNSAATGQAASPDAGAQVTKRSRPVGTCDSDMPVDAEEGDKPKDPSADSKTCEPTQIDVGEGLSQPPPGADARVRHRTRSPVDVSWREIDAGGAGACGFNSVAVAYGLRQGEEEALLLTKAAAREKTLRQQVHQWIAEHKQEASDGWVLDPRATETTEGGSLPTDFDTWHDNILRPNRWICQFTLRAAARRLGVRIVVVRHNGTSWEEPLAVGKAGRATQPLVLALRDDHYTVLVPKARRELPGAWVDCVPQGALSDHLRGGAGPSGPQGSSAGSQASCAAAPSVSVAWLPPPEPSDSESWLLPRSTAGAASGVSWLPAQSSAAELKNRANLDALVGLDGPPKRRRVIGKCKGFRCLGSACRPSSAPTATSNSDIANLGELDEAEPPPQGSAVSSGKWPCPVCHAVMPLGTQWHHVRTRHPDVPVELFKVQQPLAVVFSKELPDDQTGFQCPFKKCRMRLPHLPSQARKRAKREHLRLVHPRYKGTLFQYSSLALKGAPKLTPGVSRTQRAKHAQERAKKQGSHDLVVYRPAAWPKDKRGSFVVCRRCLSVTQHEAPSIRHLPCEERLRRLREKPLVRMRKRQWWLRLKNTDVLEGQEFLRHTGLTTAQVDELVGCNDPPTARQQAWAAMSARAKAKANKRKPRTAKGGGPKKRPASRLSSAQSAKHRLGGNELRG